MLVKPVRGFVPILVVVVIALAVGAVALFGYQKYLKKPPVVDQKTEVQSSPLASVDETSNWKTFIEESYYKLSFKYPTNWEAKGSWEELGCGFYVGPKDSSKTGFGLCAITDTSIEGEARNHVSASDSLKYSKSITVSGRRAIEQLIINANKKEAILVFVENNQGKTLVLIGFNGESYYTEASFQETVDQILSTFKFISDETAGWKTYTNNSFNFTFQYPQNWSLSLDKCSDIRANQLTLVSSGGSVFRIKPMDCDGGIDGGGSKYETFEKQIGNRHIGLTVFQENNIPSLGVGFITKGEEKENVFEVFFKGDQKTDDWNKIKRVLSTFTFIN